MNELDQFSTARVDHFCIAGNKDRLVPELRLQNINDMQSANHYLQKEFIPEFWQQTIEVNARNTLSEFTPVPEHLNLDDICVQKEYRKIRNDHTFSYGNKFYLIESPLKHSIAKQKIEIRKTNDNGFIAYLYASGHYRLSDAFQLCGSS